MASKAGDIALTYSGPAFDFNHLGRVYTDGGNIGSYQIILNSSNRVRDGSASGECITDNACYVARFDFVPDAASGAEMGILALINGLANPSATGVAYNTHGIAPGARLNVFTTPAAGASGHTSGYTGADAIYRARGIDVGRDSGADKDRNIVIINNNMTDSRLDIDSPIDGTYVTTPYGNGCALRWSLSSLTKRACEHQ